MLTTLAAALSLAASMAIDVPYLPQTDALCGGAAAAMVFRYWGDTHADAQEFAPLVDRRAGGIASGVLTDAVSRRGWRTARAGSLDALAARVRDREPVIVLLPDRGDRYHYVVVTAVSDAAIGVHDPAWGPSRSIRTPDFEKAWQAAGFWSLVILPPPLGPGPAGRRRDALPLVRDGLGASPATDICDARLNLGISVLPEIRNRAYTSIARAAFPVAVSVESALPEEPCDFVGEVHGNSDPGPGADGLCNDEKRIARKHADLVRVVWLCREERADLPHARRRGNAHLGHHDGIAVRRPSVEHPPPARRPLRPGAFAARDSPPLHTARD